MTWPHNAPLNSIGTIKNATYARRVSKLMNKLGLHIQPGKNISVRVTLDSMNNSNMA